MATLWVKIRSDFMQVMGYNFAYNKALFLIEIHTTELHNTMETSSPEVRHAILPIFKLRNEKVSSSYARTHKPRTKRYKLTLNSKLDGFDGATKKHPNSSRNRTLPSKPVVCLCTKSTKFVKTVTHSYKLKYAYISMDVTNN
jgi:hypothetical protein